MKDNETDYLDTLFAPTSDVTGEAELDLPLVDVPDGLSSKLYAIAEPTLASVASGNDVKAHGVNTYDSTLKHGFFGAWPKVTGIAASLLVAIMGFQFYQQQQTLKQLEQAQTDLATALHYLGEANRITRAQVLDSLNGNINKTRVLPVIEIERDTLEFNFKQSQGETKPLNHTL